MRENNFHLEIFNFIFVEFLISRVFNYTIMSYYQKPREKRAKKREKERERKRKRIRIFD